VELKARFDEATNVNWAKQLERAGVHVVYGLAGLKTHSKCVLVVRDDGDQLRRYCHIGTGNYNTNTARIYEDLGIVTCDNDVGADVAKLFNHLTGYSRDDQYHTLVVAPRDLRPRLLELIDRESTFGAEGHLAIKANAIADAEMIEALYRASAAGVRVDLVIRGISSLRAGVAGLSDNIHVRSILGRYLEHSRIYRFAHGDIDDQPLHLIGSADLMPRNLDRRVEVLVPIEHPKHREWIDKVLEFQLADDIVRWELQPDDAWIRRGPEGTFEPNAQSRLYRWVVDRQSGGVRE
jgi:polyphosphate kinase